MTMKNNWIQKATNSMEEKNTIGTFTRQAKRHNMTPIEFAEEVIDNKDRYSEKTFKRAMFVKNLNPEKFVDGGELELKSELVSGKKRVKAGDIQIAYFKNNEFSDLPNITSSEVAYDILKKYINNNTLELQESFIVLYLNAKNEVIGIDNPFKGGITATVVDKRIILSTALKMLATGIILCHNHPSGNTKPSESDKKITKEISEAGKILDIKVLDHIIITKDSYYSFTDYGILYEKGGYVSNKKVSRYPIIGDIDEADVVMEGSSDKTDSVTMDIPLLIRTLELAREDVENDADLHRVVERLIEIRDKGTLTMDDYDFIADVKSKYANGGEVINDMLKNMKRFLGNFPNNAKSWRDATDEIRDLSRESREYLKDYDNIEVEAVDFKKLNTPALWNKEGKKSIISNFNKMSGNTKSKFYNRYSYWFDSEEYAKGGEIDKAEQIFGKNKEGIFELPFEMAVYIPSTQDVDKVISLDEMQDRVEIVRKYLSELFGGYTSGEVKGGFVADNGELVNEDVVKVTAFSTKESFEKNKDELLIQLGKWGAEWEQEAIGFEYEGDLFYVPQNYSSKNKMKIGGFVSGYFSGGLSFLNW